VQTTLAPQTKGLMIGTSIDIATIVTSIAAASPNTKGIRACEASLRFRLT
jgi:hypothetical protein